MFEFTNIDYLEQENDDQVDIWPDSDHIHVNYGYISSFLRIILVLLCRLGFVLVQLGTIPVENVYRITFYNIFEIGNTILSYLLLGYMISFGKSSFNGWVGYSNDFSYNLDMAIFGLCASLIGTGQISTFLAGRIHLVCSMFITFFYSAVFQPFLMHWIWSQKGWMKKAIFLETGVSVQDFGGNLVVHLSSSLIGTIGCIFLGRRLIKVKDVDEHSLAREHSGNTLTGQIFILLGYIAFTLPSPNFEDNREPKNYIANIMLNNAVAFATGILIVSFLHLMIFRKIYNYWTIVRCFQGGLAGTIAVAAAIELYSHLESLAVAAVVSVLFFFVSILIHNSALEDNSNLIASHLIGSFIASFMCPIVAHRANFNSNKKIHILWQFICICVVLAVTAVFAWLVFLIFALSKLLRNKEEVLNHRRATILQKFLPKKGAMERLFMIDSKTDHIVPGESSRRQYVFDKTTNTDNIKVSVSA
ncbi:putative ammonium transporter 1 [Diabrotica undecimpunctata]|uniref:putative ammonium transporter 1 n=1 Tax=Diabrotica undecimpunctata TaxID=50387 RepID=UPI003B632EC3